MPTVFVEGPYRFFFYSNEGDEPAHIHVRAGDCLAKFWINPVALASSHRFAPQELRVMLDIVQSRRDEILEAWHEHFDGSG